MKWTNAPSPDPMLAQRIFTTSSAQEYLRILAAVTMRGGIVTRQERTDRRNPAAWRLHVRWPDEPQSVCSCDICRAKLGLTANAAPQGRQGIGAMADLTEERTGTPTPQRGDQDADGMTLARTTGKGIFLEGHTAPGPRTPKPLHDRRIPKFPVFNEHSEQ